MGVLVLLFVIAMAIIAIAVAALVLGRSRKSSDSTGVAPPIADPQGESKFDSK